MIIAGFLILLACGYALVATKAPKYQEPLCIDPFTSADLGTQVFTWCKNVPMWSTKA